MACLLEQTLAQPGFAGDRVWRDLGCLHYRDTQNDVLPVGDRIGDIDIHTGKTGSNGCVTEISSNACTRRVGGNAGTATVNANSAAGRYDTDAFPRQTNDPWQGGPQ